MVTHHRSAAHLAGSVRTPSTSFPAPPRRWCSRRTTRASGCCTATTRTISRPEWPPCCGTRTSGADSGARSISTWIDGRHLGRGAVGQGAERTRSLNSSRNRRSGARRSSTWRRASCARPFAPRRVCWRVVCVVQERADAGETESGELQFADELDVPYRIVAIRLVARWRSGGGGEPSSRPSCSARSSW